jgi:hypothetical protein
MFKAFVLVRNLECHADHLVFDDFSIKRVGGRFQELRELFVSADVNVDDWVFEKSYAAPPPGPPGLAVGRIPNDIEDALLLLRLWKPGDIAFVRQSIILPSGNPIVQFPYKAMNDLNSYSAIRFEMAPHECEEWDAFAKETRARDSWHSAWFAVARRFFLSGGAEEFNPRWDAVDRIVDYATTLEATLVPEMDFAKRRMSNRGIALLGADPAERDGVMKTMKTLYDVRSTIVHGTALGEHRQWLIENCAQIELLVRKVLTAALEQIPAKEEDRRIRLKTLYDPTDEDRKDFVIQKLREIKTPAVHKALGDEIGRILSKGGTAK